jgi:hypothetical protein
MLELRVRSAGRAGAWFRVDAPDHVFALAPTITHAHLIAALPELANAAKRLLEEAEQIGLDHSPGAILVRDVIKRITEGR